jgi:pimeloyl-ACP methyl ester carboxylesterase
VAPVAELDGVEIAYDAHGSATDPAILLIAGFGAQLISWADGFCRRLAEGGRYVVRFDNRDCGLSTKLESHPVDLGAVIAAASAGDLAAARDRTPYTLREMADDAVGLLDALGIREAHVVGASMGGMIAQLVAIRHPRRVASLTSMMSSTGEPDHGQSTPEAQAALLTPAPDEEGAYVAAAVASARIWGSREHFDADAVAALAAASFARCFCPAGVARQLAALLATGSLAEELRRLDVPALVIHGLDDTLVTPSGGKRTAQRIRGSRLLLVPGMGHDRPEPLWPLLCGAILDHTGRSG